MNLFRMCAIGCDWLRMGVFYLRFGANITSTGAMEYKRKFQKLGPFRVSLVINRFLPILCVFI